MSIIHILLTVSLMMMLMMLMQVVVMMSDFPKDQLLGMIAAMHMPIHMCPTDALRPADLVLSSIFCGCR